LSLHERAQFSCARSAFVCSWLDAAEVGGCGCRTRKRWEGVHNMAAGRLNNSRKVSFFLSTRPRPRTFSYRYLDVAEVQCYSTMLHPYGLYGTLLAAIILREAAAACYYRNGTLEAKAGFRPCATDPQDPMSKICCATWDTCHRNGLCQSQSNNRYYRESCTLSNWESGGCQDLCSTDVCYMYF
jgi:hypothetical protein